MEFKCLFLLSLVLVSTFICCHSEVIRNSGPLSANFGQTTYIQKSDLRIKPGSQSSDCSVKVLYEETSFSSRIGRLFPSQFSCNYKEGSVYYEHYGSSLLNHTAVKLLVTYFTNESERVSLPVYLKVDILPASSSPFNCIVRNLGLTAGDASDFSNPISSSNLAFLYNRSREECTISVLNGAAPYSWPR
ncbi:frem3 [Bugula neritina]|uniref:Frem3 n=1 Tax=Bugula neritina TaxID=10212 RepID=A0A7J7JX58_BUGNE|nr:frem3 [Bugula neritina]